MRFLEGYNMRRSVRESDGERPRTHTKISLPKLIKAALSKEMTEDLKDIFDFSESSFRKPQVEIEQLLKQQKIAALIEDLYRRKSCGTVTSRDALASYLMKDPEIPEETRKKVSSQGLADLILGNHSRRLPLRSRSHLGDP